MDWSVVVSVATIGGLVLFAAGFWLGRLSSERRDGIVQQASDDDEIWRGFEQ